MNRTVKIVFVLSLIANVLLIGVLAGALPHRFGARASFRDRFRTDIEKLPEPARSRLRDNIERIHRADAPLLAEIERARSEALRIISADPFDEAAYDRQVQKISELRGAMFKRMSDNMKQTIKGLPVEQRKTVAEIFRRPPPGSP
ncbi:MAG TPA: periplasmic heavy metal sensor [Verrucomicrobiae bacterium]|jgi:uncharacterized membrane protein|nr:periplasmic heavy metal sensor [Verrucomicrobiae bacterium]